MRILTFALIFITLFSYMSFAQSECDYKIEILTDGDEFDKDDFVWRMMAIKIEGESTLITGTARIEDPNGKTVKSYKPWASQSISRQKTSSKYSPNLREGEEYEIIAEIAVGCDDTDNSNNKDTKPIKIKGVKREETTSSETEEAESTDDEIEKVELTSTKTRKNEIITIMPQDTTPKEPKKEEGIEEEKEAETQNTIQLTGKDGNREINIQPTARAVQNEELVYASSNEKAKELMLVILLILSILFNIILIWRR